MRFFATKCLQIFAPAPRSCWHTELNESSVDPKESYDIAKMPKLFLYVNWPTVATCSCLPVDATLIDCNLFALQIMPRKLLLKPHGQMAVPNANDF